MNYESVAGGYREIASANKPTFGQTMTELASKWSDLSSDEKKRAVIFINGYILYPSREAAFNFGAVVSVSNGIQNVVASSGKYAGVVFSTSGTVTYTDYSSTTGNEAVLAVRN